jgi:TolB-like protein
MGESDLDHRADIYALGVLGYELLTGAPPFPKSTAQAILSAHVLEEPVDLHERNPAIPESLSNLVMRCLEKNREDRWNSAEEMVPLLETAVTPSGGLTPTGTRPIPSARRRIRRRRRTAVIGAVGLVLAAIGGRLALAAGDGINQIAILPIRDISGNDSVFVDGMHDELISTLARAGVADIVPRAAVSHYLSGASPTHDVAAAVKADAVLESTVYRDGDRIRVNVQLVEAQGLRHLWAQSYERVAAEVLGVQREVVASIAAELKATLNPDMASQPATEQPPS